MSTQDQGTQKTFWKSKMKKKKDLFHRPAEEIRRDMNIGPFQYLLLWLAKTDIYVLSISTFHSRSRLQGLGMMVIFTGMLAFSSSIYTLSTALIGPDTPFRWMFCLFLAAIYTFGIVIIDREIVGATSADWRSMFARLVFAVFIAMAVSYPVKLKFFEGRLNIEIDKMINEKYEEKTRRIAYLETSADKTKTTQINNIQQRVQSYNSEIQVLDNEIDRESKVGFCGIKCQGYISQKEEKMEMLKTTEMELKNVMAASGIGQYNQEEIERLRKEVKDAKAISFDILTKYEALKRLEAMEGSNVKTISFFLFAFFMLLELVPLVLKWSLGYTEYHYYIEARNNLNKQKIVSITNLYMKEMIDNNENVFKQPREITNTIAAMLEDESCLIEDTADGFDNFEDYFKQLQERKKNQKDEPFTQKQPVNNDNHTNIATEPEN